MDPIGCNWLVWTQLLGGWEGYELGTVGRVKQDEHEVVWIELLPYADRLKLCSGCRKAADSVHDWEERWIQDLPMFDTPVELLVHRCRS